MPPATKMMMQSCVAAQMRGGALALARAGAKQVHRKP